MHGVSGRYGDDHYKTCNMTPRIACIFFNATCLNTLMLNKSVIVNVTVEEFNSTAQKTVKTTKEVESWELEPARITTEAYMSKYESRRLKPQPTSFAPRWPICTATQATRLRTLAHRPLAGSRRRSRSSHSHTTSSTR